MIRRDLIIVILATFCLTAIQFKTMPVGSEVKQYEPWLDYNDDGKIDLKDVFAVQQAYGTSGDPTKNVTIARHATKLITAARAFEVPASGTWTSGLISVDGYIKFAINIYLEGGPNKYRLWNENDDGSWMWLVDEIENFPLFVVKTYDVSQRCIEVYIENNAMSPAWLFIDIYLIA